MWKKDMHTERQVIIKVGRVCLCRMYNPVKCVLRYAQVPYKLDKCSLWSNEQLCGEIKSKQVTKVALFVIILV